MSLKIAESTTDKIYSELGDPNDYPEGEYKTGTVVGQIVEVKFDGEFYTPKFIDYKAQTTKQDDILVWKILSTKIID